MSPLPAIPWAKLVRSETTSAVVCWHSLVDHSADVAAAFHALIGVPLVSERLARLAGAERFPDIWRERLSALVALHDFGKANRGFQARWNTNAEPVGHTREAWMLLRDEYRGRRAAQLLGIDKIAEWGGCPQSLLAVLAHHGRPLNPEEHRDDRKLWGDAKDDAPVRSLADLGDAARRWFPAAFAPSTAPLLPDTPRFWHAVAGLTMLADWLGSDTDFFPFANGPKTDRMDFARKKAQQAVSTVGFDPALTRKTLRSSPRFDAVSEYPPRPMQRETGERPGHTVVLESETGSGKTEAALYRFARLFAVGEVDGLYFALPTRVAATSLYHRVLVARDRLFPDRENRPGVTLAVPGYLRFDGVEGKPLPDFGVQWPDDPKEGAREARWAATRPKRYLAGTIAVGTIDQALLGAIAVKHAHLRAASLMRHLLVVDEVHASDRYMEHLLKWLLEFHRAAGGHALLLSATLGSDARARLLAQKRKPSLEEAIAAHYPAISTDLHPEPVAQAGNDQTKQVACQIASKIDDPVAVAERALAAARKGAKVLVIRNTRRNALATFDALMELSPDAALVFSCDGVPTLHHGRFAREDRALLDKAVEDAIGRERLAGGLVLIGTQTLEQSLDIDADLVVTDLCPADVLLQRLGRLHRHEWRKERPAGFEMPSAIVLAPDRMEALLGRGRFGLGGENGPYDDLVAVEATRRLLLEYSVWSIPEMNRLLVERATHPQAQEALVAELERTDARWRKVHTERDGRLFARGGAAAHARLRTDVRWDEQGVVFPQDESFATRLGLRDLAVVFEGPGPMGPFGQRVRHLAIPRFWLRGAPKFDPDGDVTPRDVIERPGRFAFTLQGRAFCYGAEGLKCG